MNALSQPASNHDSEATRSLLLGRHLPELLGGGGARAPVGVVLVQARGRARSLARRAAVRPQRAQRRADAAGRAVAAAHPRTAALGIATAAGGRPHRGPAGALPPGLWRIERPHLAPEAGAEGGGAAP